MPKQLAESKKLVPARPDRAALQARKEATQRVEELKLKLMLLADRYFEQSLSIIKSWLKDGATDKAQQKR
jgi:hypothetical protein